MVRLTGSLLLFAACALAVPASPSIQSIQAQQILSGPAQPSLTAPRRLQGRFLHITDIHPDPYYKPRTDPDGEHPCHAGDGSAGYYGAQVTDCDSPFSLVNATFQWINDNVKDDIDFVIWTGDSARHDNDEHLPRTEQIVVDSNRYIVDKFVDVFGKTDNIDDPDPTNDFVIPIVPTFGNNDILPHNIFEPGPNKWTRRYSDVWSRFVPPAQRHSFARGGWFFTEVIPNRLAIFSLNTLYFFDSNSAVDGCDLKSEPGFEHMEWLRVQLQFMRERGMKAILTGHVPPARTESKQSWDETCYQKYTLWLRQYRDVVVGSIWGHMNIDHFMFHDVKDLTYDFHIDGVDDEFARNPQIRTGSDNGTFTVAARATYLNELRDEWSSLPTPPKGSSYLKIGYNLLDDLSMFSKKKKKGTKKDKFLKQIGGPWGERFSMGLIAPSVVPNYYPTLRIVEYNITGLENEHPALSAIGIPEEMTYEVDDLESEKFESSSLGVAHASEFHGLRKDKKGKKGKKKKPKPPFKVPKAPSTTASPGPAYSLQSLTLLSWTQYYANLTKIHEAMKSDKIDTTVKKNHNEPFQYQVEYTTNNDDEYKMKDLTVRSWLDLAQKIGRAEFPKHSVVAEEQEEEEETAIGAARRNKKHKKHRKGKKEKGSTRPKNFLWRTFVKRAFVNTKPEEDLDDQFG